MWIESCTCKMADSRELWYFGGKTDSIFLVLSQSVKLHFVVAVFLLKVFDSLESLLLFSGDEFPFGHGIVVIDCTWEGCQRGWYLSWFWSLVLLHCLCARRRKVMFPTLQSRWICNRILSKRIKVLSDKLRLLQSWIEQRVLIDGQQKLGLSSWSEKLYHIC